MIPLNICMCLQRYFSDLFYLKEHWGWGGGTEIFHLFICSTDRHDSQVWISSKSGDRNCVLVYHILVVCCCHPRIVSRRLEGNQSSWDSSWHSYMVSQYHKKQLTECSSRPAPHIQSYFRGTMNSVVKLFQCIKGNLKDL